MEMSLVNFVEPGDTVVVIRQGLFGQRMAEAAAKLQARVVTIDVPWGEICSLDQLEAALQQHPETRLVAVVMAETSTGAWQPLAGWADLVHRYGALLLVDTVTALGGMSVEVDAHGFDIVFSGSQKCLSAPPGLAPLTVNDRALARLDERQSVVPSWYFDLKAIAQYWGQSRIYHHTAPVSMIYALSEALALIREEGLARRFQRHRQIAESLWAGLEAMGLTLLVDRAHRLPTVTVVRVPAGVDERAVRQQLLQEAGIEIAGGLGQWAGKVWRIGVMGEGAQAALMLGLLTELGRVLRSQGVAVGSGVEAFEACYQAPQWEHGAWHAG
jgi:alanine-glyoxylate transaminase/serine-glyoxylate transaminase/serine-pyruvate transaminase